MVLRNDFIPFFQRHIHLHGVNVNIAITDMGNNVRRNAIFFLDFRQFSYEIRNLIDRNYDIFSQEYAAVVTGSFAIAVAGIPNTFVSYERFCSMIVLANFVSRSYAVVQVILIIGINRYDNVVAIFLRIRQFETEETFGTLDRFRVEEFNSRGLYTCFLQLVWYGQGVVDIFENADCDTIGGFITETLGRIPQAGETLPLETLGYTLTVAEATPRAVTKVTITRTAEKTADPQPAPEQKRRFGRKKDRDGEK